MGRGEGLIDDPGLNVKRLRWFRIAWEYLLPTLGQLRVHNSGSVLNPRELPPAVLEQVVTLAGDIAGLKVIALQSREAYITAPRVRAVVAGLEPRVRVRPILGVETINDAVRNDLLNKRMSREGIQRAFEAVGEVRREGGRVGMDVNVIVGLPGVGNPVDDAVATARYVAQLAARSGVGVDITMYPFFRTKRSFRMYPDHPRCALPVFAEAAVMVHDELNRIAGRAVMFLAWEDDGLDLESDARDLESERIMDPFGKFNRTNDPDALAPLL
jgi:hypothetical protein